MNYNFWSILSQEWESNQILKKWRQSNTPKSIKGLRGFLGTSGYYRKFVRNYAHLAAPLTDLLKKDNFLWSQATTNSMKILKEALTQTPVLSHPDFTQEFAIETDASQGRIGAILSQNGHPIVYYSAKLARRMMLTSTYVKKMYAITQAIGKWRHYLLGHHFVIRIDHHSIKNIMTQIIQTSEQHKILCKLLGYKYSILYKPGKENKVVDSLSREFEEHKDQMTQEDSIFSLSKVVNNLVEEVLKEQKSNNELLKLRINIEQGSERNSKVEVIEGLIFHNKRYVLDQKSILIPNILREYYDSPIGGHFGVERTRE